MENQTTTLNLSKLLSAASFIYDANPSKIVFTLRGEGGYYGCVKLNDQIHLTPEVFPTAFQAANKARNLQKNLKNKDKPQTLTKPTKVTSEKVKKQVTYSRKFHTFRETQHMPLLKFQEVWVITKGDTYVREYLDKQKQNLVTYTTERNKAKIYKDHEEAKMNMRVLKNLIGPGFNLMRFFVENK